MTHPYDGQGLENITPAPIRRTAAPSESQAIPRKECLAAALRGLM